MFNTEKTKIDPLKLDLLRATIFDWMETHGVQRVTYRFSGENDSGQFDADPELELVEPWPDSPVRNDEHTAKVAAYCAKREEVAKNFQKTPVLIWEKTFRAWNQASRSETVTRRPATMAELVLELSEKVEATTPHGKDWWNNDGGQGSVEWILNGTSESDESETHEREIVLTVSQRIIEYESDNFHILAAERGEVEIAA